MVFCILVINVSIDNVSFIMAPSISDLGDVFGSPLLTISA